ncbi:hypothetical protein [Rossellomorea sp. BNER]|uniref:hypothetical protein n=1 Tax=Rossellomorea sp. BNER TaxID=2962031 RepID=UPI003AF2892E|nr:hypothetical protein [Rossellomorea sp. BNER]
MKYKVRFRFDNENSKAIFLEADNEDLLNRSILSQQGWFSHKDENGATYHINMKLVTSITVIDAKKSKSVRMLR